MYSRMNKIHQPLSLIHLCFNKLCLEDVQKHVPDLYEQYIDYYRLPVNRIGNWFWKHKMNGFFTCMAFLTHCTGSLASIREQWTVSEREKKLFSDNWLQIESHRRTYYYLYKHEVFIQTHNFKWKQHLHCFCHKFD
jgi:hypothetical protein